MTRKKAKDQEVAVDKMDNFLRTNYKTVIIVIAGIFIVFIAGYGIKNFVSQSRQAKAGAIGQTEALGFYTDSQIKNYTQLADTLKFAKDYIHMQAAEQYARLGYAEEALSELGKTGGAFTDYAKSLQYDMDKIAGKEPALHAEGPFAPVWYYRAALAAEEGERAALIAEFKLRWPESLLLAQIEKWGLK